MPITKKKIIGEHRQWSWLQGNEKQRLWHWWVSLYHNHWHFGQEEGLAKIEWTVLAPTSTKLWSACEDDEWLCNPRKKTWSDWGQSRSSEVMEWATHIAWEKTAHREQLQCDITISGSCKDRSFFAFVSHLVEFNFVRTNFFQYKSILKCQTKRAH